MARKHIITGKEIAAHRIMFMSQDTDDKDHDDQHHSDDNCADSRYDVAVYSWCHVTLCSQYRRCCSRCRHDHTAWK